MGTAGCRYTYGTDENTANRTFVNIKEVIYLILTKATNPEAQLWITNHMCAGVRICTG